MNMRVKAVLFDIDGTLIDSNDLHVLAWEQAFREHGIERSREQIHAQIGKGADMLIPALAPELDAKQRHSIDERHGELFQTRYLPRTQPFPCAEALLKTLHSSGLRIVLASSAARKELNHYIELLHASGLIAATTSGDDVTHTKPAAEIFEVALSKIAPVTAREALAIGDSPYDAQSAGKCELRTIGVRSGGFSDADLNRAGVIALYDDACDLLKNLESSPLSMR
jgi:phosphoglycolate phosphatase-like HAD superfamily hydrolase